MLVVINCRCRVTHVDKRVQGNARLVNHIYHTMQPILQYGNLLSHVVAKVTNIEDPTFRHSA